MTKSHYEVCLAYTEMISESGRHYFSSVGLLACLIVPSKPATNQHQSHW